jgi:hypothetical protein
MRQSELGNGTLAGRQSKVPDPESGVSLEYDEERRVEFRLPTDGFKTVAAKTATSALPVLFLALVAPAACGSPRNASVVPLDPVKATTAPDVHVKMNGTCPTQTGFVGDDLCLAPPSPEEGFQLHYGPSDYDNPDEVAQFILQPGQETNDCFFMKTPNTNDVYYSGTDFRLRPGSHHLIGQSRTEPVADGFAPCEGTDGQPGGLFFGAMTGKFSQRIDPAPENQGFGRKVPARTQAVINFHVINTSPDETLREAWANYYYIRPDELKGQRGFVDLNGGLGFHIAPGTHKTYQYSCSPAVRVRILSLAAHMHAHAERMTVWKTSGKEKTKLLENYRWEDPAQLFFDSAHVNTHPDAITRTPGGDVSGEVIVEPTEAIQWECDINNDSTTTLTFRNEVFTGEMCLVAGSVVSADDPAQLADFICNRN